MRHVGTCLEAIVSGRPITLAALPVLKPRPSKVFAVEFDKIEGTKHDGMITKPITEGIEYREAAFIDHDGLIVDDA